MLLHLLIKQDSKILAMPVRYFVSCFESDPMAVLPETETKVLLFLCSAHFVWMYKAGSIAGGTLGACLDYLF